MKKRNRSNIRRIIVFIISLSITSLSGINIARADDFEYEITKIGEISTNGQTMDVIIKENIAYIADSTQGFLIFNISDPTNPQELYHNGSAGMVQGLDIVGNLAYLVVLFEGVKIFNISSPIAPEYLGEYSDTGALIDIQVEDNVAYYGDHGSGTTGLGDITLLNVSDPTNPTLFHRYSGGGKPSNLFVKNHVIFSADYEYGFEILDASNVSEVSLISKIDGAHQFFGVYAEGDYVYFTENTNQRGLYIYNTQNLSSLTYVSQLSLSGDPCDLVVRDQIAYVADVENGVYMIDVTNPASPILLGQYIDEGQPFDVFLVENRIFVADMAEGVKILDYDLKSAETKITGFNRILIPVIFLSIAIILSKTRKQSHR